MKKAISITARLICKAGLEEEFKRKLVEYEVSCIGHAGLIVHSIQQNCADPREFIFYEMYDSEESLTAHRHTPEVAAWIPIRDRYIEKRVLDAWHVMNLVAGPAARRLEDGEWS